MGTRSLTVFLEEKDEEGDAKEIVVMYRQFDGYPSGHGLELAEFLASGKVTNGLPGGHVGGLFNGAGCLAASVVCHFKMGKRTTHGTKPDGSYGKIPNPNRDKPEPGGFYLHPAGTRDAGEQFIYFVWIEGYKIFVRCEEPAWTERDYGKPGHPVKKEHPVNVLFSGDADAFLKWCKKQRQ